MESRKMFSLPNAQAYNRWAPTYDSDGNILQALDSFALRSYMLSRLLSGCFEAQNVAHAGDSVEVSKTEPSLRCIDLGAGTGRATLALLDTLVSMDNGASAALDSASYSTGSSFLETTEIIGLDSSDGMLALARSKIDTWSRDYTNSHKKTSDKPATPHVSLKVWDMLTIKPGEYANDLEPGNIIVSTLVLEHIPLDSFFGHLSALLCTGGFALVTNMHADMGNSKASRSLVDNSEEASGDGRISRSQTNSTTGAGFLDPTTGEKIRAGTSYAYAIDEVIAAARHFGLRVVGPVEEQKVTQQMVDEDAESIQSAQSNTTSVPRLSARGRKWIGVKCWFGIIFQKKID